MRRNLPRFAKTMHRFFSSQEIISTNSAHVFTMICYSYLPFIIFFYPSNRVYVYHFRVLSLYDNRNFVKIVIYKGNTKIFRYDIDADIAVKQSIYYTLLYILVVVQELADSKPLEILPEVWHYT